MPPTSTSMVATNLILINDMAGYASRESHISVNNANSSSLLPATGLFLRPDFMAAHTFSIGFRSGDTDG